MWRRHRHLLMCPEYCRRCGRLLGATAETLGHVSRGANCKGGRRQNHTDGRFAGPPLPQVCCLSNSRLGCMLVQTQSTGSCPGSGVEDVTISAPSHRLNVLSCTACLFVQDGEPFSPFSRSIVAANEDMLPSILEKTVPATKSLMEKGIDLSPWFVPEGYKV